MIETVTWKLGNIRSSSSALDDEWYELERGTTVYSGDPVEYEAKIGLIYASDYSYATSGGSTGRDACLSYALRDWNDYSNCYNNDWLYFGRSYYSISLGRNSMVLTIYSYCGGGGSPSLSSYVYPSLYLASNVSITGRTGTETNPYTLS